MDSLTAAAAAAAAAQPSAAAPGPDEQVHRQRMQHSITARARRRRAERRDPACQRAQRRRERLVRAEAAALASAWQDQGVPAGAIADLLDCPARTLRHWQHELIADRLEAHPLGRPHRRCTSVQGQEVICFLHGHGPWVGMPTLTGAFAGLPAAELRDLLGVFRHLWTLQHPRESSVLQWHQVGTVWAMDFTKASQPIDGVYPYVFAVRDLASGLQLAWRPVRDLEAATAQAELEVLFTIHGAPLVLKSDNGSAFRAASTKNKLGPWRVWPLYSPPGRPGYKDCAASCTSLVISETRKERWRSCHFFRRFLHGWELSGGS